MKRNIFLELVEGIESYREYLQEEKALRVVEVEDRDTRGVFGDYVSIYDIQDAVDDGATVPIVYEARQIRLRESADFQAAMREAEALQDERDKDGSLLSQLMGTDERLAELAADFVHHFEQRLSVSDGKAMLVAASRPICVKLYDKIVALRPEWHHKDVDKGAIKIIMSGAANDPTEMQPHLYGKMQQKTFAARFKNPDDGLKVVIVCDMWLTGFDAPCCHTMYIDKPMKGHNLMQAIARVNRVFRNKSRDNGGLVVDYIGLTDDLREATDRYTRAQGKGEVAEDIGAVLNKMHEWLDIIRGQFATLADGKAPQSA